MTGKQHSGQRIHSQILASSKGFRHSSVGKESARNAGDLGSIPGSGRSPGEGKGYPLQCSGLENSICIVHGGCEKSDTTERLSLSVAQLVKNPPTIQETPV